MKAGTQNHVKVRRLKRVLGIPLYQAVGILETLWLLCIDCCDEGNIGKFTDEEIADYMEWRGDPSELVRGLSESGWTDLGDDGRPVVHDWLTHCPEYIKERVRKRHARAAKPNKQRTYDDDSRDTDGTCPDLSHPCPVLSENVPSIPNPTQPNPTQPIPTPPPFSGQKGEGVSWKFVSRELKSCGVNDAASAVKDAKANGLAPQDVLNLIAHYRASPGAWEAGALHYRVRNGTPETPSAKGWPPPAKAASDAARERESSESRRKERAAASATKAADVKLETDFGERLDSMDDASVLKLVNGNIVIGERLKKHGRKAPLVRSYLLAELSKVEGFQ